MDRSFRKIKPEHPVHSFFVTAMISGTKLLRLAVVVLLTKVFVAILWQYRHYFPPDFDSDFLSGRRYTFTPSYQAAFYTHLVISPVCLALAVASKWSAVRYPTLHRILGRCNVALILSLLIPSGLYMARQAYGGSVAVNGFMALTASTALSALFTGYFAWKKDLKRHQQWAVRLLLLLISPLILRLFSGLMIVLQWDSPATYGINAWCSWLIPLLIWEWRIHGQSKNPLPSNARIDAC